MPKDVDVVYCDEHGPTMIKQYHFQDQEDIQGWYYFSGELYLPKTYLKNELKLKPKDLEKIISDENVRKEVVENQYRTFTVFNLEDAKESISKSLF